MTWTLCADHDRVVDWMEARFPAAVKRGWDAGMRARVVSAGYEVGGQLVAGFLFFDHIEAYRSIHAAVALERPPGSNGALFRGIFAHIMRYPFEVLKCQRVTAIIPKRHLKSRALVQKLGFKYEGKLRQWYFTEDGVIYSLLRRDASRWLSLGEGIDRLGSGGHNAANERGLDTPH